MRWVRASPEVRGLGVRGEITGTAACAELGDFQSQNYLVIARKQVQHTVSVITRVQQSKERRGFIRFDLLLHSSEAIGEA